MYMIIPWTITQIDLFHDVYGTVLVHYPFLRGTVFLRLNLTSITSSGWELHLQILVFERSFRSNNCDLVC